jgi:uncharacterized protein
MNTSMNTSMNTYMKPVTAFLSGALFSVGLGLAGMLNPKNVFGFLDLLGEWKPGLAFVMMGAIPVYFLANQISKRSAHPAFETNWSNLPKTGWDFPPKARLGALLFGIGWALSGLCPGPALVSTVTLQPGVLTFGVSMIVGFIAFDKIKLFHGH